MILIRGGLVRMRLWNPGLLWERTIHNLIVNAGEALLAAILAGVESDLPSHMAIGDDDTASVATMTALQGTEHTRVGVTGSADGSTFKYLGTFTGLPGDVVVREMGIFNAASAGTMLARWVTLPTFTLPAGATFEAEWASEIAREV